MWNIIKKDLLIIARDRAELLVLLLMPFILISILGFALGGLISGNQTMPDINVALVEEDQSETGFADFTAHLQTLELPEGAVEELEASVTLIDPIEMVKELFENPEVSDAIEIFEMNRAEAEEALAEDEVAAMVTIPSGYTFATLEKMFLETGDGSELELLIQDFGQVRANVIKNMLESFVTSINLEMALAEVTEGESSQSSNDRGVLGDSEYLSTREPVTAFQYYTIGMAVMFALYVAGTISSNATLEKETKVFDRLMLTGQSPLNYLTGKMISTIFISVIQLGILFSLSTVIFQTFAGESFFFWLGVGFIIFVFSLSIGAIAALLTSISLRYNSYSVSGVFSGGVVTIFAFLGGSFTQVEQISPIIRVLGNWTPNGASMTLYMQLLQGVGWNSMSQIVIRLLGTTVLLFILAIGLFPKRRSV
ncbi:ABC-2 type transport system permease protein [Natronobacillus azotifigens]|uniref:ABC transporter permease n=1 Tax=Natronobacillus azotifigens TaxID=472978 RepID=A0A9J6RGF8_9BACI|nr:ABC transporter permease [Natronobacillus azotifigens]